MKLNDLIGQKFGKLTVISRANNKIVGGKKRTMWICQCDCDKNKEIIVSADYLKRSACPSCGCEATKNRIEKTEKIILEKNLED